VANVALALEAVLDRSSRLSSISPVAIFPIMTARPIASAGRFSPRGPLDIEGWPILRSVAFWGRGSLFPYQGLSLAHGVYAVFRIGAAFML